MSRNQPSPDRFVGLDVHKHYLIAVAVDPDRKEVMGPCRVALERLDDWVRKSLTAQDAVVLEMTTNAYQLYDDLLGHVHSVTVVHPPHVALITRAQVMTDKIAARTLAKLHAGGLLPSIWIPPLGSSGSPRPGGATGQDGASLYPGQESVACPPPSPSFPTSSGHAVSS